MDQVRRVGIAKPVVPGNAKSGQPFGSVLLVLRRLSMLVCHALTPSVVAQQIEAERHLMLVSGLQGVITAVALVVS